MLTAEDIEEEEDGEQVQEGEEALVVVQGAEHININIITDVNININSSSAGDWRGTHYH